MTISTLHGGFVFAKQRLITAQETDSDFLEATKQAPVSAGLEEFGLYYLNRMSFHEVGGLLERRCGPGLACEQTLWNWALQKALEIDTRLADEVQACQKLPFPQIQTQVDIYSKEAEEVLVLTDAIGVKSQKPTREKPGEPSLPKEAQRHDTDVLLLEQTDGEFVYLMGSTDETVSLVSAAAARLRRDWGNRDTPLPVVALTDGARSIRRDLTALFGPEVTIILDWYHLEKRVYEHLAMMAHSKSEREEWERSVLGFLWQGKVAEAVGSVGGLSVRNEEKRAELLGYLEKHAGEIIDYSRRKATGKWVGSGCMEKAVDQVIGIRQKKKGMSWTEQGSRTLAQLKIAELNGQWEQLFAA